MHRYRQLRLFVLALTLGACKPEPVVAPQTPTPATRAEIHEEWPRDLAHPNHPSYPDAPTPEPEPVISTTPAPVVLEEDRMAIVLPSPPPMTSAGMVFLLSTGGRNLVLEFETGGRSGYDPHPEWPGGASGVTIGIGYDLGYYSKATIDADWQGIQKTPRTRLLSVAGLSGTRARNAQPSVRDIFVAWALATDVFDRVDVAREYSSAKRAIPGFEDLRPNAQAAIISLGFNRGWQMSGSNRVEFRAIRDLVPARDYEGMARQMVKMKHVWAGTSIEKGMYRRRDAEAKLLLTP